MPGNDWNFARSKLHEGNFLVNCEITRALALIRNVGSNLELSVKLQALLTETPLFNPETCGNVVCAGIVYWIFEWSF